MKLFLLLLAVYSLILNRVSKEEKTDKDSPVPATEYMLTKPGSETPELESGSKKQDKTAPAWFTGFALYGNNEETGKSNFNLTGIY